MSSPYPRSSRFSSIFSSRSFGVSHFAFRSVILFELIFVKDERSVSVCLDSFLFFCFTWRCSVVLAPVVEKTYLFSIVLLLLICQRSVYCIMWVYFWVLSSVLLIYLTILLPLPHYPDYCSFIDNLEVN